MIKVSPIFAALLLAGCVSTTQPAQTTAPAGTASNIAERAGYASAQGQRNASRANYDSAVDAGIAAGMTRDMGGAGLALGVLGWLASSPDNMWADPSLLITARPGTDRNALATRYGEMVYRATGHQLERSGYTRVTNPSNPTTVTFIQPGCKMTSRGHYEQNCSRTYWVSVIPTKDANTLKLMPGSNTNLGDLETFNRRVMAQAPNELSLFIPARKVGGKVQPARVIHKGKETAL